MFLYFSETNIICEGGIVRLLGILPSVSEVRYECRELKGSVERLLYIVLSEMYSHLTLDATAARFHGFTLQQRTCGDAVSHSPHFHQHCDSWRIIWHNGVDPLLNFSYKTVLRLQHVFCVKLWKCGSPDPFRMSSNSSGSGSSAPVPAPGPACLDVDHKLRHGNPADTYASSLVQFHLAIFAFGSFHGGF